MNEFKEDNKENNKQEIVSTSEDENYALTARFALGAMACLAFVAAAIGGFMYREILIEEAHLAESHASGSEYLGVIVGRVLVMFLVYPSVPALFFGLFAIIPNRITHVMAKITTMVLWTMFAMAAVVYLPLFAMDDMAECIQVAQMFMIIAVILTIISICVCLASNNISNKTDGHSTKMSIYKKLLLFLLSGVVWSFACSILIDSDFAMTNFAIKIIFMIWFLVPIATGALYLIYKSIKYKRQRQ